MKITNWITKAVITDAPPAPRLQLPVTTVYMIVIVALLLPITITTNGEFVITDFYTRIATYSYVAIYHQVVHAYGS